MYRSIPHAPRNSRAFIACLLSFMTLIAPIASVGAATRAVTTPPAAKSAEKSLTAEEQLEAALFEPAPAQPAVPLITATKTDSFPSHPSGQAQPGDEITYDIGVTNSGTDATNTTFNDTIDVNTALVPGSLKVSPVAAADSYLAEQSVALSVGAPGVLTNDYGTPAPTVGGIVGCLDLTAPFTCTTTGGGTVVLEADGSFNYTPLGAFTGADTFIYTSTNLAAGGLAPDDTATVTITVDARPTVSSTTPTNGATNQATGTNLTVTFSEPVNVTGAWFTISCTTSGAHTAAVSGGTTTYTLNPDTDFTPGETCTVTIVAAQVSDVDANDPPDLMAADHVFSFSMDAAPSVSSTTPTNGATGVPTNSNITLNFSESVSLGATPVTISCATSGAHTFVVSGSPNTTFTVNPNVDFAQNELCTVTVLAAQVTDTDTADPPDNMPANYVFSFTTDAAPSVTSTTPTNGATNQTTNTDITLNFSESVSLGATPVTISCTTSGAHTFVVSASPNTTFTVNPNLDFAAGETCTVTVLAAQVTDTDSNDPPDNMAANFVFSFSTDAAPTVTATTPTNGATQVANNANVSITFSESVNLGATPVTISCATSGAHTSVVSASPNTTFTVNPDTDFTNGELCTVTVLAAEVTDNDANDPPDNMAANFVFSFTIDQPPSVTTTSPTNSATDVLKGSNVILNFSEAVNATGSSFSIQCPAPGNLQAFAVSGSGTNQITLNPTADLPPGVICTVSVIANQVSDTDAGDPPDEMVADFVFSFGVKPEATDDARNTTGNIRIQTAGRSEFSVITNDLGPKVGPTALAVSGFDATSLRGGTVTISADGRFTYNPPAGYEGSDSFNYTIANNAGSDVGTVNITITGMIWFVNASAGACTTINGTCGRLTNPFSTLAAFETANGNVAPVVNGDVTSPEAGDHLFIHSGTYNSSLTLENNQRVIGQGSISSLQTLSGITPATDSDALPATAGTNPIITNNAGAGIVTAQNNRLYGLTVQNTTGTGISGNNFGTLTISENMIVSNTTTAGTGVSFNNGTLAATFRSISAGNNDGNPDPANGIVLTTTTGTFTVDGDGTNTSVGGNASGGTIQNMIGADGATGGNAVFLQSATGVTLRRMTISGTNQNHGIRGVSTNNFTLEFSTVTGANGTNIGIDEGSVNFDNLTGTAAITSCVIEGGLEDNLNVVNTSGTLNRLVITGSTFGFNNTTNGNNNILIESRNAGTTLNFTLQSSIIKGARADWINFSNNSSSTMDAVIGGSTLALGNTFDNLTAGFVHPGAAAGGNRVVGGSIGTQTVDIRNNTMKGSKGEAIRVRSSGSGCGFVPPGSPDPPCGAGAVTGTVNARVRNNVVGVAGTANSGSSEGSGIFAFGDGGSDMTISITDNIVVQHNNHGIRMLFGDEINNGSNFNATVTGNSVSNPGNINSDFNSILLTNGTVGATDDFTSCVDIGGSTAALKNSVVGGGSGSIPPNNVHIRVNQRMNTTVRLPGYVGPVGGGADVPEVVTYLTGRNTLTTAAANTDAGTGGFFNTPGGVPCTQPSVVAINRPTIQQELTHKPANWLDAVATIDAMASDDRSIDSSTPKPTSKAAHVTKIRTTAPTTKSQAVSVDRTVPGKSKSVVQQARLKSKIGAPQQLSHHARPKSKPTSLKSAARARAVTTTAPIVNPTCGVGTIAICLGTLKAGKTVNIQFKVTVNTPFPSGTSQVSNQGTVAADGGVSVMTDDPAVGGASDPTVTPVQSCTPPPMPGNMVAWWSGDDTPRDIAGGHDGTLNGGIGYAAGKVLNGFLLDGAGDYLEAPDHNALDLTTAITIDAWINPTNALANGRIVDKITPGNTDGYLLDLVNGALRFTVGANSSQTVFTIPANTFSHVAATYDGTNAVLYFNGASVATTPTTGPIPVNALPLRIGADQAGNFGFAGLIDEVEVFNVALTPAQVLDIYNADSGGKCKPSDLRITKTHTDPFVQGSTGNNYTITVHNDGPATTSGTTTVTENLPAGLTATAMSGTGWTCGGTYPVDGPAVRTCTSTQAVDAGGNFEPITLTVTAGANTPSVVNNVTVSGGGEMDTSDDSANDTTNLTPSSDLLAVKVDSPDPVTAGTDITYAITVTNNGPSDAQTVTLTDAVPANTTFVSAVYNTGPVFSCVNPAVGGTGNVVCSIATMPAGTVSTFTMVVKVNAATPEGTTITNNAVVASTTTDPFPLNNTGTATTSVIQSDIEITSKTDTPDPVEAGSNITYTVNFKNNSAVNTASNVTVTDATPAGTTFISAAAPAGWTPVTPSMGGTGNVVFSKALVAGSETAVFTIVVKVNTSVTSGTIVTNTATAATTSLDTVGANNSASATTTVEVNADLAVTSKTDTPDPVIASQNITYAINFQNNGPSDAQGVTITDAVPAGTTFISASVTTGSGWTIPGPPAVGGTGNVVFSKTTVAVAETAVFEVVVKVNNTAVEGSIITNSAVAAGTTNDPTPGNNTGTATTTVNQSDIEITSKTDTPDPVNAGENITYTINFKNNSAVNSAADVSVTDTIPVGTTYALAVAPAGWTLVTPAIGSTGNVVFSKALVAASETATFTIGVKVNASVLTGTTITNTATAATTSIDTNSANNSASATTTTGASADLAVTKTDTPDPVTAGDNITYTINFVNNGPSDAQTVTVTDAVPADTTFVSAAIATGTGWSMPSPPAVGGTGNVVFSKPTVAAGETATFTIVVKVNSNVAGASTITNTATAASATTDPTPGNDSATETTTVVTSADLLVVKVDTPDPVAAGENLTYTITVTNGGFSDAQSLSLSDTLPGFTTLVSFTVPAGWVRTDAVPPGGTGTVTATATTLASGANSVFTLVVLVNPATPHNTVLTNTASASSVTTDPNPGNNSSTIMTTVVSQPDMTVTKTHVGNFVAGQVGATYTITVNNIGSGPTNGSTVTVTDNLPVGLTPTAPNGAHNGWSCSIVGQLLTCTRNDVLAGTSNYPPITLTVNVANPAPLTVTNTVTVAGGGEIDSSNNSASDVTNIDCTQDFSQNNTSPLVISRFRENGPGGVTDEFVEIFNPSNSAHTVASGSCTGGYGVFASAGNGTTSNDVTMVCQIPNGTVIPARGYYLCTGAGYTLGDLGRNGGSWTAEGDALMAADIPNDAGLALINVGTNTVINTAAGFAGASLPDSGVIVYDKVGFAPYGAGAPASAYPSLAGNFCEGTCLQPVGDASNLPTCTNPSGLFPVIAAAPACYGQSGQYELLRRQTVFNSSTGTLHQDTNINTADLVMVSPNPSLNVGLNVSGVAGIKPILGAASPHDSTAPADFPTTVLSRTPFDVGSQTGPRNAERLYSLDANVADVANNPLGTYALRFKYTNNSGSGITGLRFSIDDLSTLCGPQNAAPETGTGDGRNLSPTPNCQAGGTFTAILKALNSSAEVLVDSTLTAQSVKGTVIEDTTVAGAPIPAPGPHSPLGGGIDSSFVINPSTSSASLGDGVNGGTGVYATAIGSGTSLRVKVKFGVVRTGRFVILVVPMGKTTP